MIVVTGTAPRSGTSAMMRTLLKDYFNPHTYAEAFPSYVAREKNPEGFWDVKQEHVFGSGSIPYEPDSVIKLWAPHFPRVNVKKVSLLVIMQRENFSEQIKSMHSCAIAEGLPCNDQMISHMFKQQQEGINKYFTETPQLWVKMGTLREDPDSVVEQIKEMI